MERADTARLAGEAFTVMTGADLVRQSLTEALLRTLNLVPAMIRTTRMLRSATMKDCRGQMGRSTKLVELKSAQVPEGHPLLHGRARTRAHCIDVLKNGYQRQRILAAHYLCLLDPGTPLFNTSAPAWRQQRLLAKMT